MRKGERVSFVAIGTIQWGSNPDQVAGPQGHGAKPGKLGVGGLIGGCVHLFHATQLSLLNIREEVALIRVRRERQANADATPR